MAWTPEDELLGAVAPGEEISFTITYLDELTMGDLPVVITPQVPHPSITITGNTISGSFSGLIFDQSFVRYLKKDQQTQVELPNLSLIPVEDVYGIFYFQPDARDIIPFYFDAVAGVGIEKTYRIDVNHPSYSIDRDALLYYLNQTEGS